MKKNFKLAFVVLAAICFGQQAKAQLTATTTGSAKVNIVLADALSITMGATPDVTFTYNQTSDYAGAKSESKPAHFTVISNRNYDVTVSATALSPAPAKSSVNSPNINVDDILAAVKVKVLNPVAIEHGTPFTVALATSYTGNTGKLATNAAASTTTVFDIEYSIPDATPLFNVAAGTYSTTVKYTATQL